MIISPVEVSPEILDTLNNFELSIFASLLISISPLSVLSPICIFEEIDVILLVFNCFVELILTCWLNVEGVFTVKLFPSTITLFCVSTSIVVGSMESP